MPDISKIKRSQIATFIDTTPSSTATYKLLGVGVTEYAIAYNPQTTTEKWIIHDNANTTHDGNQKQGAVSQKAYKGDEVFEYIAGLRDKFGSDVKTTVLDVDMWDATGTTTVSYAAKKSDVTIIITSFGGEDAVIEYTIYYDGDPVERKRYYRKFCPNIHTNSSLTIMGLGTYSIPNFLYGGYYGLH